MRDNISPTQILVIIINIQILYSVSAFSHSHMNRRCILLCFGRYFGLFEEMMTLWLSHTGVCSALVSWFVMIVRCWMSLVERNICVNVKSIRVI